MTYRIECCRFLTYEDKEGILQFISFEMHEFSKMEEKKTFKTQEHSSAKFTETDGNSHINFAYKIRRIHLCLRLSSKMRKHQTFMRNNL